MAAEETSMVPVEQAVHEHTDDHLDKTVIFGRTIDFPVYTVVFGALGVLTILEVLLAEILTDPLHVPVLVGIAFIKAGLVMWFYMHLKEDSRLFAWAILIPAAVAMLSLFFLMAVPHTGY
jgi:cytochrome c oxidase subunit 4